MQLTQALPLAVAGPRGQGGFTLIELMVTLAVFAILCLLAMPSFNTWIANDRVRAVAQDMANGLRLAQTEALRRSRQSVFALITDPNPAESANAGAPGYHAVNSNATNWAVSIAPSALDNSASTSTGTFVHGGTLGHDIGASVAISGPAVLCFDSVGRMVTDGGASGVGACGAPSASGPPALIYAIKSAASDHPLQIEVGLGGQVRLCNPARALPSALSDDTPGASEGCQYPPQAQEPPP